MKKISLPKTSGSPVLKDQGVLMSPVIMFGICAFLGMTFDASIGRTQGLDPFLSEQWGLKNQGLSQKIELDHITAYRVQARIGEDIQKPLALTKPNGRKIRVAVLDTGLDWTHPDLRKMIRFNESECRALEKFNQCLSQKTRKECESQWMNLNNPEVDLDKNGYPMDCHGWSLMGGVNAARILGRPDFTDDQGHGTHVAGIIGAEAQNRIGVAGVASHIELIPVQVLGKKPSEPIKPLSIESLDPLDPTEAGKEQMISNLGDLVARGVTYAIRSKADVINFSMGWPESSDSLYLRKVIAEAQKRGILIVAAAGNDSTRALLRPCAYPGVICVGAHGPDGSFSHFSNYGSGVDLAAPGTNILSTWPMSRRPVRFRSSNGYEYLNGTSQASPFVAGAVAELLSQGIPAKEIRARLISGSRKMQEKLPLLEGSAEDLNPERRQEVFGKIERKWILSGLLDLGQALAIKAHELILPHSKEKTVIKWDGKSKDLSYEVQLENIWSGVSEDEVTLTAQILKPHPEAVRPVLAGLALSKKNAVWGQQELRNLRIDLLIQDDAPARSKIPADFDLALTIQTPRYKQTVVLELGVVVQVDPKNIKETWTQIPILKMPAMRTSLIPIDENLDGKNETDYLAVGIQGTDQIYHLIKYDVGQKQLEVRGSFKARLGDDQKNARDQYLVRQDLNFDGISDYVVGLYIDNSDEGKPSPARFYFLDSQFKPMGQITYDSKLAPMPTRVFWHRFDNQKRPAWVGSGKDPGKKPSLRDDWENPEAKEKSKIRFYYLGASGELKTIERHNDFVVVDSLEPTLDQVQQGIVPVLLAKNRGTKSKPSYMYDFATAEIMDGKVTEFKILDLSAGKLNYRNLLDTRVDRVVNLDPTSSNDPYKGTFWFSEGPDRSQRVSLLIRDRSGSGYQFQDATLPALRGTVDSSLWVRAAYASQDSSGAFVFTNSELHYFDLRSKEVVSKSLERYTFYSDLLFSNLHFPSAIKVSGENTLQPALFTTESSGFQRGVSFKMPIRSSSGKLIEIITPARLKFESSKGCRPLETPIPHENGGYALDYYCGDKMIRVPLEL